MNPEDDAAAIRLPDPISIPTQSMTPGGPESAMSTEQEYDRYFGIVRENPDLVKWSRSCLSVQQDVSADLIGTGMPAEAQADLMRGLVLVLRSALSSWVAVAGAASFPG